MPGTRYKYPGLQAQECVRWREQATRMFGADKTGLVCFKNMFWPPPRPTLGQPLIYVPMSGWCPNPKVPWSHTLEQLEENLLHT